MRDEYQAGLPFGVPGFFRAWSLTGQPITRSEPTAPRRGGPLPLKERGEDLGLFANQL